VAIRVTITDLEELDESECWDLLAQATIGRLGLHFGAMPRIVPVNFALLGKNIVVRTAVGAAVTHALRDSVVAFQVDNADLATQDGWSVVAVGQATRVTDLPTLQQVDGFPLGRWAPGHRHCVTRIEPRLISGRRFVQRMPVGIPEAAADR
jgi:hypothetical protein